MGRRSAAHLLTRDEARRIAVTSPSCRTVAMLIRLEWPMHSTEQPTDPEGDQGRGIGLRLDSGT